MEKTNLPKVSTSGTLFKLWLGCAFFVFVYCILPLRDAFQFADDEHFELSKAALYRLGFPLYTRIWSDQPPLFTLLLSALFRWTGVSVFAARIMVLTFASLLLVCLYSLVEESSGRIAAIVAAICMLVSPFFLGFSVSAVQEIPMISTGLVAAALLILWKRSGRGGWLFLSGLTFGLSLAIKFTAAILLPAIAVGVLTTTLKTAKENTFATKLREVSIWLSGCAISLTFVLLWCGGSAVSIHILKAAHFSAPTITTFGTPGNYPFRIDLLKEHIEVVFGAVFGIWLILWREQWRRMAFPLTLLVTVFLIHAFHRPFWDYYYLHLSVPMVWLTSDAAAHCLREMRKYWAGPRSAIGRGGKLVMATGICLCASLVIKGGFRLASDLHYLNCRKTVYGDPVLERIIDYRNGTHWLYTSMGLYGIYANLPIPPETAVVSLKRLWSGEITADEMLECLKRYQPEQILLAFNIDAEMLLTTPYVKANYRPIYADRSVILLVSTKLYEVKIPLNKRSVDRSISGT